MKYDYWSRKNSRLNFMREKKKSPVKVFIFLLCFAAAYLIMAKAGSYLFAPSTGQKPADQGPVGADLDDKAKDAAANPAGRKSLSEKAVPADPWAVALGSGPREKTVTVATGDTLIDILLDAGLPNPEAYGVVNVMKDVFDPADLRQGQELRLAFADQPEDASLFKGLCLKLDVEREVQVMRCPDQEFKAREFVRELEIRPARAAAEIDSSLYEAALDADLPIQILMQMVRAYSYDVDFQRDIQPGDRFEILYEEKIDRNGDMLASGGLLMAVLHTRGRDLPIYRFETGGEDDFFDANGKSVRKTLMVTPIDGARISSRYGMRRHPIQGYNRMHRGLDFAAPSGTPIMAAGDGIVEYAGRNGGYGNYIRIRHPNDYKTIYGHMSKYARGIRKGARVKQGDTIGYVGSTGLSTGPHLHYEVQYRRKAVNPASVKTPPGRTLAGQELQKFLLAKKQLEQTCASLKIGSRSAEVRND